MKDENLRPSGAPPATPSERIWSRFQAFLDDLPPRTRAAFLLHDVFGIGYADIAFVLGDSQDQCRARVERARAHAQLWRVDDVGGAP